MSKTNIKKQKQSLLDQLYEPYKNCTMCPLGNLGRKKVVFGSGNPDADLLIIGEGPGQQEDEQGAPFVGKSGKLLDKALNMAGIKRKDIFITNIVKCRPPNNRAPQKKESITCKNLLLLKQIKIIEPKIICTLGSSSTNSFLEEEIKISDARGKVIPFENFLIFPTYHPAYALRSPKNFEIFAKDIQAAKKLCCTPQTG